MDARNPRDGTYIEMVGWYDPMHSESDKTLQVNPERVMHWVGMGAQLSECAEQLVRKAAPQVVQAITQRTLAKRAKARVKRRAKA
jgi:ribosomal protein S16